jgi:Periplasmic copper-binding protein (NosD)
MDNVFTYEISSWLRTVFSKDNVVDDTSVVEWWELSSNPNAMHLLEKNPEKIH